MHEIDHKTVISGLDRKLKESLLARSDSAGLKQASIHFGLIFSSGLYIYFSLPLWQLMLVVHGILLIFLFSALHESIHETAFKAPWINRIVSQICGFIILLPPCWFRQFHFAHHRQTNIPGLDPELDVPKPQSLLDYLKYLSGIPMWLFHSRMVVINALGKNSDEFVAKNKLASVTREARWFIAGYFLLLIISLVSGSTVLVWLWLVPIFAGQPFLRAYLLAEHTLCPQVENMLGNTRTTLTSRLIRMLAWNMPYHAEHHSLPSVPFHKLPEFHTHLKARLYELENGYLKFHRKMLRHISYPQS